MKKFVDISSKKLGKVVDKLTASETYDEFDVSVYPRTSRLFEMVLNEEDFRSEVVERSTKRRRRWHKS